MYIVRNQFNQSYCILLLTYPVQYKMSVILNVCKLTILKCIMSKYSKSVESFSRQGNAFFFTIK